MIARDADGAKSPFHEFRRKCAAEVGVHGIHPELVKLLGMLKYRYSYAQNVLMHSIEAAFICGAMAAELGSSSLRVNGLVPGYFRTDLNEALTQNPAFSDWLVSRTPLGRWGETDELIGAAVFLASDAASFVTGQIIYVDGGITSAV